MVRPGDLRPEPEAPSAAPAPARPSRRDRLRRLAPLAVLVLVGAGAYLVGGRADDAPSADEQTAQLDATVRTAVSTALEDQAKQPPDASVSYQVIAPSIVVVQVERAGATAADDTSGGLGTGVVINDQGLVLTARHVVAGAQTITLTFGDGTATEALVAGEEPEQDIAVLQPRRLPEVIVPAVMGRVPQVGEPVFAVGHPLGLTWSLSAGVVSGLDRSVPSGGVELKGLIQFDAAVNPGNSGGPLLNRSGQVVGIVTALANPSKQGYFVGIGFAVPIGTAAGGAGGPSQ